MNIILFEPEEVVGPFLRSDPRIAHLLDVLRRKPGDTTDVGLINGPRGKALLTSTSAQEVHLEFTWDNEPEPLLPIDLIVGLSRPQTSRKVLQAATSLGVRSLHFASTERGEKSYGMSKLWTTNEWKNLVRLGVEQAFSTRFPEVKFGLTLEEAVLATPKESVRVCMDNYEAPVGLREASDDARSVVLALGSERGWSGSERDLFRRSGFVLAHLGKRPLRTETATVAAVSIVASGLTL